MNNRQTKPMRVSDLVFDVKNPRLPEFDLTESATDSDVIRVLWETMDVRELVMSIVASGYFPHEPLIVARELGKNVVIEGNRRLAAVKVLLDSEIASELSVELPCISEEARLKLQELPTIESTREDVWRYLGFKHVNGPAKWSSYAKSRYIAEVHRTFEVSLEDIASQIGDTHKTVQRLYRGLMVIEEAEELRVFSRNDRWRNHFSFSHLYTGLDYDGISNFIGLLPETEEGRNPVPHDRKGELRELCLWLYGSKKLDTPPVIEKQNPHLRQLSAVIANRESLAALRSGVGLESAFESSRPSSTVFEETLLASKRNLEKARALLSTGYDGSEELLKHAGEVATLAYDLHQEMLRKKESNNRRHSVEGY